MTLCAELGFQIRTDKVLFDSTALSTTRSYASTTSRLAILQIRHASYR